MLGNDAEARREADKAAHTLIMLAYQVGIKCASCGTVLRSQEDIGGFSFMAPFGTRDYQARAYCDPCADGMRGE
jgi:hypothetical protein